MVTKTDQPEKPFSHIRDGNKAYWSVPYDMEFREAEPPNVENKDLLALSCIGHHVVTSQFKYCPSYHVVFSRNVKTPADQKGMPDPEDYTIVINKVTGRIVYLSRAYSEMEAVVSWYAREHGHDGSVLCLDRTTDEFYIEAPRTDLIVALNDEGQEVPLDEATKREYRIDLHSNAVMLHGE